MKIEGIVDDPELISGQRKPLSSGGSYSRLVDARAVTKLLVTADCVESLSEAAAQPGVRRVTFVTNADFVYAMMHMYEGYAFEAECFVCRGRKAALAWLVGEVN